MEGAVKEEIEGVAVNADVVEGLELSFEVVREMLGVDLCPPARHSAGNYISCSEIGLRKISCHLTLSSHFVCTDIPHCLQDLPCLLRPQIDVLQYAQG